jgi:hypothetical protein
MFYPSHQSTIAIFLLTKLSVEISSSRISLCPSYAIDLYPSTVC